MCRACPSLHGTSALTSQNRRFATLRSTCCGTVCNRGGRSYSRSPLGQLANQRVRFGSWLCENAKTLNRDRRSYSSKTVLVAQQASGFNLEIELKNIILRRVSIFEFLHSQGHRRTSTRATGKSALHPLIGHRQPSRSGPKSARSRHPDQLIC